MKRSKTCAHCKNTYWVEIGVTFNVKNKAPDGLQPWCCRCQQDEKRWPRNGWFNFLARIEETGDRQHWTRESYEKMMGDFRCHYCGVDVTAWSTGYWVDRVSSRRGYLPDNCVPCCWGCNRLKSNRNPESFAHDIANILGRYGRGKVQWDEVDPKIRHTATTLPDLRAYLVTRRERQPSLFGGAA